MNLLTPIFQHAGDYVWLAVALTATGVVLVIVNVSAHAIQEHIKKRQNDKSQVRNNLKPILKSAESVLRALVALLVQPRHEDINEAQYRIASLRLTHLLASIRLFQRNTYNLATGHHLEQIESFLDRKIPMALRGRVYNFRVLPPELQEELASIVGAESAAATPADLDEPYMRRSLDQGDERQTAFAAANAFFNIQPGFPPDTSSPNVNDERWVQFVALCHAAIYILDLVADFTDSPKWEEYRLYFVSIVKEWSGITAAHKRNKVYLYTLTDLNTCNYIHTFHDSVLVHHPCLYIVSKLPWCRTLAKAAALNLRGRRFKQKHHPKRITRHGVRVIARKDSLFFKYAGNRPDIRRHLVSVYLNQLT